MNSEWVRARDRAVVAAMLLTITGAIGCAQMPHTRTPRAETALAEAELREELVAFSARFASAVDAAGEQIREATDDPVIRRRVLLWEVRMIPLVQEAAVSPEPRDGFVAINGLLVAMRKYFTEGDGSQMFGPQQPIAVETAEELEDDFYQVGRLFLSDEDVTRLRRDLAQGMEGRAISGRDFTVTNIQRYVREARETGRLDWVWRVPMSPFRALEGVGSGAAAMHDFNDTAIRFSRIVEALPQQMRWQSELLLYDIESRESLNSALVSFDSLAESARQLAASAENLPTDLDGLIAASDGALAEANRALVTAREIVEPLRITAEQMNLAGSVWAELIQGGELDPEGRPFDVLEYKATAREVQEAAAELRQLAVEIAALRDAGGADAALSGVDAAVARAASGGRGVVDHAAWRGLQLLLVAFVLLLAYRWITSRFGGVKE